MIVTIKRSGSNNSGSNLNSTKYIDFVLIKFVVEFGSDNLKSNSDLAGLKDSILVGINCKLSYICKRSKALIIFCTNSIIQI